jgi:hypothetical protein
MKFHTISNSIYFAALIICAYVNYNNQYYLFAMLCALVAGFTLGALVLYKQPINNK